MKQNEPTGKHITDNEDQSSDGFDLHNFFPYLVRIYYRSVSQSVSNIYATKYGLSVSEWRAMAVLGPYGTLSASEIVKRSSMDKVNVSRAIKGLQKANFLKRDIDGDDKRRAVLRLTEEGRKAYSVLVPMVKELEENLLVDLDENEVKTLISLMEKVRIKAENLS